MSGHSYGLHLGAAFAAAAIVLGAPAAQAFTMNTLSNPGGGSSYSDPADRLGDALNGKSTTQQQQGGFQFSITGADGANRPFGGFGSGSDSVGRPLDYSKPESLR